MVNQVMAWILRVASQGARPGWAWPRELGLGKKALEATADALERPSDDERLRVVHERIASLKGEARHEAARRASRSYSAPGMCVRYDGCHIEGDEMVWPDGERYPTRSSTD